MFENIKLKFEQWNKTIHVALYPGQPAFYTLWYDFALEVWRINNGYTKEAYSRWKAFKSAFFGPLHYPPRPTCDIHFLNALPQPDIGKYMHMVTKMIKEERDVDDPNNKLTSATNYEILTAGEILRLEAYYRTYCPDYIPEEEIFNGIPN